MYKVLAKHKWVAGATISESADDSGDSHRFVATIRGFRNWVIWEGSCREVPTRKIIEVVKTIRDRIDKGDERVFHEPQPIENF